MKRITRLALVMAVIATVASGCCNSTLKPNKKPAIAKDSKIESAVKSKLKEMTLEEKAGQMIQITIGVMLDYQNRGINEAILDTLISTYKIGSFLNVPFDVAQDRQTTADIIARIQDKSMEVLGIPSIYGLDMIHGASYVRGATFFPQEINLGATFNPSYATAMGEVIGYETRAALCPWVFSPVMDLSRNALWPRNWESWGEDPYLQTVMAKAETKAIQGDDPNHIGMDHVAVSLKHYMGYGAPASGKDRTPAYITPQDLRDKYFAPFKASVLAGALTVMVNSAAINGIPTHANTELLTGWLKDGLKWDGMIITDWADINNLYTRDHVAVDKKDALRIGINAGIDMVMETYDPHAASLIVELANEGAIPMSRIDDAVARILRLKYRLGLFDNPKWDITTYEKFGCSEFAAAALDAAAESAVLLKNEDNVLPLKLGSKILLTGPGANSMRALNGGWSYTWQGIGADFFASDCNTIYEAFAKRFGEGNVRYVPGVKYIDEGSWQEEEYSELASVQAAAHWADVVVACIGENSYCETPGNISDLTLSEKQRELVKLVAKCGKPVILVLGEGRPRIVADIEPLASAVVDIMLPGNYGGDALAYLFAGDRNFSGKLPFTYPKYANSIHTYDYKVSENVSTMEGMYNYDAVMDVQWPFGAGLSYTTFKYSDLKVKRDQFKANDNIKVSVKVENTGKMAGKEAVLLYSSDIVASVMPDVKRLRAFEKVSLEPGKSTVVEFEIPASDLAFVGADGHWTLEEGDFRIAIADQNTTIHCTKTKVWNTQNIQ